MKGLPAFSIKIAENASCFLKKGEKNLRGSSLLIYG